MNEAKKRRIEGAGWRVGSVVDFLGLTPADEAFIELRIALVGSISVLRKRAGLTQRALAKRIGSSQSRVARVEGGDPEVSIDLLVRTFLSLATISELGRAISSIAANGRKSVRPRRRAARRSRSSRATSRR